jgi:hypothetical protein
MRMGQLAARKQNRIMKNLPSTDPADAALDVLIHSELDEEGKLTRREALLTYSVLASKDAIRCLWLDVEAELVKWGKIVI